MATVKILVNGYAKKIKNGWRASSTVCLIRSKGKKIITDPGCNRKKLLQALDDENIKTSQIDYVFLSHRHPDHILLASLFEKAKYITFDQGLLYDKDNLNKFKNNILGDEIKIIKTPGHVNEHLSLIVNTEQGKIAIAGDAIWWPKGQIQKFNLRQMDYNQAVDMDTKKLINSRKKLLKQADYIIPGHGKKFKVN